MFCKNMTADKDSKKSTLDFTSYHIPVQCYNHSTHQSMHCTLHFMVFCNCQPKTVSSLILYWLLHFTSPHLDHGSMMSCSQQYLSDFLVIDCPFIIAGIKLQYTWHVAAFAIFLVATSNKHNSPMNSSRTQQDWYTLLMTLLLQTLYHTAYLPFLAKGR